MDSAGNLYVADTYNLRIRKISTGMITTVAGNGAPGFSGDNGPATSAQLTYAEGVAVDSAGNLYIADSDNSCIRKVSNGVITTVAGNGIPGFTQATTARPPAPSCTLSEGVAVDSAGSLYIADTHNQRIRKVANGVITTVAGGGSFSVFSATTDPPPAPSCTIPKPPLQTPPAAFTSPTALNFRIRKVSGGTITTVARTAKNGFSGNNGPKTSARLNYPEGVAVDSAGNLYIVDAANYRIRKISGGVIKTVAGNGTYGSGGDGGSATSAAFTDPDGSRRGLCRQPVHRRLDGYRPYPQGLERGDHHRGGGRLGVHRRQRTRHQRPVEQPPWGSPWTPPATSTSQTAVTSASARFRTG